MRVLVTGGAGYIGSHLALQLVNEGHTVHVVDNLSNSPGLPEPLRGRVSFFEMDISSRSLLGLMATQEYDAVVHFASSIFVGQSVTNPSLYYKNNLAGTINLLDCMSKTGVENFVFSSSAAVYGNSGYRSTKEDHLTNPTSPYGRSKLMVEQLLPDYERAYGIRSVCLRYFNAAGASPELGENHLVETHLIPLAIEAAYSGEPLKVFGTNFPTKDGTCVRDYIHVLDLADAHSRALVYLDAGRNSSVFNLGTGRGYTVFDVIHEVSDVTGLTVPFLEESPREGDPPELVSDASKAMNHLGFLPKNSSLRNIVRSAVDFYEKTKVLEEGKA